MKRETQTPHDWVDIFYETLIVLCFSSALALLAHVVAAEMQLPPSVSLFLLRCSIGLLCLMVLSCLAMIIASVCQGRA
jgi:hypothetical protein